MRCLEGIIGLLSSRNGTMSLIALLLISVLCWCGRIEGNAYAAAMGAISAFYTFTRARYHPPPPTPFPNFNPLPYREPPP